MSVGGAVCGLMAKRETASVSYISCTAAGSTRGRRREAGRTWRVCRQNTKYMEEKRRSPRTVRHLPAGPGDADDDKEDHHDEDHERADDAAGADAHRAPVRGGREREMSHGSGRPTATPKMFEPIDDETAMSPLPVLRDDDRREHVGHARARGEEREAHDDDGDAEDGAERGRALDPRYGLGREGRGASEGEIFLRFRESATTSITRRRTADPQDRHGEARPAPALLAGRAAVGHRERERERDAPSVKKNGVALSRAASPCCRDWRCPPSRTRTCPSPTPRRPQPRLPASVQNSECSYHAWGGVLALRRGVDAGRRLGASVWLRRGLEIAEVDLALGR